MMDVPVPGYQSFWTNTCSSLKSEYHCQIGQFPDADAQLKKLFKVLGDIQCVAAFTPVGDSEQWSAIVNSVENRQNLCKALSGETLFSALCGTYTNTVGLHEIKAVPKTSTLASQSKTPKSAATQASKKFGGERGIATMRSPQLLTP
jgi:hypothetical protein